MLKHYAFFLTILVVILVITAGISYEKSLQPVATIPQNTATQLAQTITVLRPSFMTADYIDNFTKGTPLQGHGYDFIKAEELSGIGADYLLAIAIHESGWGTNYYSRVYHQIFSWGIWDRGATSEAYYSSITGCLVGEYQVINGSKVWKDGVPVKIKKLYLTKGASYYSGETLSAINKYYASDSSWASAVIDIHSKIVEKLPEDVRAKQWIMGSKIMNGNLPSPDYYTTDYWSKPVTREELAVILWRIQNK
jgi:beta-N-acetylglucosaminidase